MKRSLYLILALLSTLSAAAAPRRDTASIGADIGRVSQVSSDDSAIALCGELYRESERSRYPRGQVKALHLRAQRYFNKGHNDSMISDLKRAVLIAQRDKSLLRQLPSLYNNLGIGWQSSGSYDSSLSCYYKAIGSQQKFGSSISEAVPYINMAMLLRRLCRYSQATTAVKTAIGIFRKERDSARLPTAYLNLGGLYTAMRIADSVPLAERYLQAALHSGRQQKQELVEQKALYELGLLAGYRDMPLEAARFYLAALQIPTGNPYDDLVPLLNLGSSYITLGRYAEARRLLEQGLKKAAAITPQPDFLCDFYENLAAVYEYTGRYKQAAASYRRYIELSDELRGEQLQDNVDRLQRDYQQAKHEADLMRKQVVIMAQESMLRKSRVTAYSIIAAMLVAGAILASLYVVHKRRAAQRAEREKWEAARHAEEKERSRIARELHDHIGGALSNARQWFATIGKTPPSPERDGEYAEALQLLDDTIAEVRSTAHYLMPGMVTSHGLPVAVETYCSSVQRASSIRIDYQYLGDLGRLQPEVELALFRCIQELLQNVVKHSEASFALVQLSCHEGRILSITVEDNGIGIEDETAAGNTREGIGLSEIRSSIGLLGGSFTIQSGIYSRTSALIELDVSRFQIPI